MQVVFTQDITKTAKKGELKNVKKGYFRNYLLPRKLAVAATESKIKETELMRKNMILQQEKIKTQAEELKKKLEGLELTIKGKSSGDKLYGSIGEKEILDAIAKKTQIHLAKENIQLSEHIKVLGKYEIPVHLTETIRVKILVEIKSEK